MCIRCHCFHLHVGAVCEVFSDSVLICVLCVWVGGYKMVSFILHNHLTSTLHTHMHASTRVHTNNFTHFIEPAHYLYHYFTATSHTLHTNFTLTSHQLHTNFTTTSQLVYIRFTPTLLHTLHTNTKFFNCMQ